MTKFEDKLEKLPIKTIQHPFGDTEYYKAVHIKTLIAQADEEFQELKEQHGNQAESILLMLEEISTLKSQLQQQALPVVPECVAEFITKIKKVHNSLRFAFNSKFNECPAEYWNEAIVWQLNNPDEFARAWLDGYEVEKPQLFYIGLPNVYGLKNKILVSKVENGTIVEFSNGKNYALKFTEQEIKSIDERYWQFAVPVEDGE
ncbi:DUF1642 domain-containing protein [Lactococcus cremoris]|uniref:DUF1642 domain-containing protein n=1 Tax=Lactococcus lactis subsp. cremoris TaxID=1359 RepID=A0AAX4AKR3_LACLC|nr:DUF1642 domain-containing protein [Lactococcus cremoris]WMX71724.1 DUF1642 domain-containing protein [Lactococcus cremoris]